MNIFFWYYEKFQSIGKLLIFSPDRLEVTGDKTDPALQVKEEPIFKDGSYQVVDLKADFRLVEFVPFKNKYIIKGYGGFIIADQDYNFITAYREPMVVSKIVPVKQSRPGLYFRRNIFRKSE